MKQDTIKKNFTFQFLYQVVILVLPLIISPIMTRRMGSTALGTSIYVSSIAYYFVVFANLGIERYGLRLISRNKDDPEKLSKSFWSLYLVHAFFSIISVLLYAGYVLIFVKENTIIYWLNIIGVASALFDITWLFYGLESFKSVVLRNFIAKISSFVFLLIFAQGPEDLPIYVLITVLSGTVAVISTFIIAVRNIKFIRIEKKDCLEHIKPLFAFFLSVVAVILYTVFDKTLVGLMIDKENVAYYEYSNKIIEIPKAFVGITGMVLLPRACVLVKEGKIEETNKYASYAYSIASLIGFGTIFGTLALAKDFAIIYYGEEFATCGPIIIAMSPLVFIICLGDIFRNIYIIPLEHDKVFIISICIAAVMNIVLTVLLIPVLGVYGAVVGTIGAEFTGTLIQGIFCRKNVVKKDLFKSVIVFSIVGAMMYGIIMLCKLFMPQSLLFLIIEFLIGITSFAILSLISIWIFFKDIKEKLIVTSKNILHRIFKKKQPSES